MRLGAIIVDDEAPARMLIREYLAAHPDVEVLAECADGKAAVKAINELEPDVVFLDVQMPGWSGFDVLKRLEVVPMIVFCTAYESYAVQAFEVSAIDYLLKPYDRRRFDQAITRVLEKKTPSEEMAARMTTLVEALRAKGAHATRLFVKVRGRVIPLEVSRIEWIEAQGDYARIHTAEGGHLTSQSMKKIESLLDPNEFIRAHRSNIINLGQLRQLRRTESGGHEVEMTSGTVLPVSRDRVHRLRKWMV
jgi:two-component system LytT family response regulator